MPDEPRAPGPTPNTPHRQNTAVTIPDPPTPEDLPASLAGYRIDRILGGGAMSTVYLAHHPSLPQWAALKVIPAERAADPTIRTRFVHEADTTAQLAHPNVVAIYGRGETEDGQLWMAMQYVPGTDAEAALQAGTMTPQRALRIVEQVAQVLDYAHQRSVVHQDIKPSNILLGDHTQPERVLLTDFGAAVTTRTTDPTKGPLVASIAYAAPEVILGEPIDGRADVYSLGCTLFRLLTGHYPFPVEGTVTDTIAAHLRHPAPRPSELLPWADHRLDDVIATALAKDPRQRFATASQLATAAAAAVAQPADTWPRLPLIGSAAHRRALIPAASLVVITIAALVWLLVPGRPNSASDPATSAPAATTSSAPARPGPAELAGMLPAGYPPGTCTPSPLADPTAAAVLSCGPNADPGGPVSATYSLARTPQALQAALQHVIGSAHAVICPGNIRSPGAWRHLATPNVVQGTLMCAIDAAGPVLAWTNDPHLLLVTARSPSLDQLYTWWTAHS